MDNVEFLKSCVEFQERMLKDAELAHTKIVGRYKRLDADREMNDLHVANAAEDIEKAKADLAAAKAELLAAEDQHGAAQADPGVSAEVIEGDT